jgi:hypothetical protein
LLLRWIVALPLAVAGSMKVLHPSKAEGTLAGMAGEAGTVALGVVELGLAAWLFGGFAATAATASAALLYLFFSGFLASELMSERPQPCGCFGSDVNASPDEIRRGLWWAVLRNIGLVGVAGLALVFEKPLPEPSGAALDVRTDFARLQ